MNFLAPLNLLWLVPVTAGIVLLYVLKLRRRDVLVPSTLLWQQVIRDAQANAPFQKLRTSLLLFLQLLAAAALIAALSRPVHRAVARGGATVVIVIDSSASMAATDVRPSRLEVAKDLANRVVDRMRPGDTAMVLSAYSRPESLTGFTSDRAALRRAIDAARVHDTGAAMRDAVSLACDLVAARGANGGGRLELVSDGCFLNAEAPAAVFAGLASGNVAFAYHPVGSGADNAGITAIDARHLLNGERQAEVLVEVRNFAATPRRSVLSVYGGSTLLDAREINIAAHGTVTQPFDMPDPAAPLLVRAELDNGGLLASDDHAYVMLRPRETVRALLCGKPNYFIASALQSDPAVDLSTAPSFPPGAKFDVVVFNGVAPAHLPEGNFLFIHCAGDRAPVDVHGSRQGATVADWTHDDAVLRYVDLNGVRFGDSLDGTTRPWARELAVGDGGTMIAAGETGSTRSAYFGFAIENSLFPLRVAFPILLSNTVHWLATGSQATEGGQVRTGTAVTIPAPRGAAYLRVTRPDGTSQTVAANGRGGAPYDRVDEAGVYTAATGNYTYTFVANLASAADSDIAPHPRLAVTGTQAGDGNHTVHVTTPLLSLFAVLGLLVLCTEWWAYHRRVSAR